LHTPGWRRRGWLALIGGVHLLAFMAWKQPLRPLAASVELHEPITYILTPFKPLRRPEPAQPPPKSATAPRARPEAITVPLAPSQTPEPGPIAEVAPEAEPATLPPDPFAAPAKPQDDLKQSSIKGAAAADRQLRKEAWTQRDRKYVNDETALATAIGKAYKGGPGGAIGEFTTPDGSRVTKWRLPGGGVVCYYKDSNAFAGGRDPFRDTGRVSVRACPG
jgi:hypothetical protein